MSKFQVVITMDLSKGTSSTEFPNGVAGIAARHLQRAFRDTQRAFTQAQRAHGKEMSEKAAAKQEAAAQAETQEEASADAEKARQKSEVKAKIAAALARKESVSTVEEQAPPEKTEV